MAGIADVVAHFAREIDEDADASAAVGRGDEQEIVGGVVGKPVFAVLTLVGVVRLVVPAALVEAPGHLAQAIAMSFSCMTYCQPSPSGVR